MMRRRYLNDEGVARLRPRPKRYTHADPELIGHYVRVLPTGVKSFLTVGEAYQWLVPSQCSFCGQNSAAQRVATSMPHFQQFRRPSNC
jgi:hypothetical protein